MSGIRDPSIWKTRYCKKQLLAKLEFSLFYDHFLWFWMVLGAILMTFVALETGLKLDDFSWWLWCHPRSKAPAWKTLSGWFPGPSNNNSRLPETDSRSPETETGSLETELRVHRIHDILETRLQDVLRSLVALLKRGWWILEASDTSKSFQNC